MKKIKRLFFLLAIMLLSLFLFSCRKKKVETTLSLTEEERSGLTQMMTDYFLEVEGEDELELEDSINQAYKAKEEVLYNALTNFKNNKKDLGKFQKVENVEVTTEDDSYVINLHASFEKRELIFHAVIPDGYYQFTELSFNPVYTMQEKLLSAFQNMIVGMGTVFAVLIFIAWIISLFDQVHKWEVRRAEAKKEKDRQALELKKEEKRSTAVETKSIPAVLEKEEGISEELLSIILMAAVKAYEEDLGRKNPFSGARTLENGLIVRSVKRRK